MTSNCSTLLVTGSVEHTSIRVFDPRVASVCLLPNFPHAALVRALAVAERTQILSPQYVFVTQAPFSRDIDNRSNRQDTVGRAPSNVFDRTPKNGTAVQVYFAETTAGARVLLCSSAAPKS